MILLISYQYYVCQKKAAYSIGTESLSHIEVLNKKRKCPEIWKSRTPFPFSIDNFIVLIKLSCCAPNFDIGPALTRIFDHGDDDGDWRVRISD